MISLKSTVLDALTFDTVEKSWVVDTYPFGSRDPRPLTVDTRFEAFNVVNADTVDMRCEDTI